jgi:hypothetical protein
MLKQRQSHHRGLRAGGVLAGMVALLMGLSATHVVAGPDNAKGHNRLNGIPGAKFTFDGPLGQRVKADVENWLLVTPSKNPGLLDIFVKRELNVEQDVRTDSTKLVTKRGQAPRDVLLRCGCRPLARSQSPFC